MNTTNRRIRSKVQRVTCNREDSIDVARGSIVEVEELTLWKQKQQIEANAGWYYQESDE